MKPKSPRKDRPGPLDRLFGWATILTALALCTSYLAAYVPPDRFWPMAFAGLSFPYFWSLNLLLAGFWAWRRKRYLFFPVAALLLGVPKLGAFWTLGGRSEAEGLRVVTFNARHFDSLLPQRSEKQKNNTYRAIQEKLRSLRPDILCGQDFSGDNGKTNALMHRFIQEELGLKHLYQQSPHLYTFSRFPFGEKKTTRFERSFNSFHYVDIERGGRTIRVFNLHLQSFKLGYELDEALSPNDPAEPATRRAYRTVVGKLSRGFVKRAVQARLVARAIGDSPHPVIVCGDFNDTPQSYTYRLVSRGLRDSFTDQGSGLDCTYSGNLPFLRIDYVLSSPELPAKAHRVVRADYSDHFAVLAVF
jgi:endonuclease/exonuclease/phosphatase family metal-dependent hydrolase